MATGSPEFQQRMSDLLTTTGMEFGMMAEKSLTATSEHQHDHAMEEGRDVMVVCRRRDTYPGEWEWDHVFACQDVRNCGCPECEWIVKRSDATRSAD